MKAVQKFHPYRLTYSGLMLNIYGPRFKPATMYSRGGVNMTPHFGHRFGPQPDALIFTIIPAIAIRDYLAKKGAISEARRFPATPLAILGNRGRPIAAWGGPVSSPNRG